MYNFVATRLEVQVQKHSPDNGIFIPLCRNVGLQMAGRQTDTRITGRGTPRIPRITSHRYHAANACLGPHTLDHKSRFHNVGIRFSRNNISARIFFLTSIVLKPGINLVSWDTKSEIAPGNSITRYPRRP